MSSNIHEAIHEITHALEGVTKQRAQGVQFKVLSESDVLEAVKPALQEHGVTVYIESAAPEYRHMVASEKVKSGEIIKNYGTRTDLAATVVFHHVESETEIKVFSIGSGFDYSNEHDAHKAHTRLLKNAFLRTFLIETSDTAPSNSGSSGSGRRQQPSSGNGNGKNKKKQSGPKLEGPGKSWAGEDVIKSEGWLKSTGVLEPDDHRNHTLNLLNLTVFEPGFTDELGDKDAERLLVGWAKRYYSYKDTSKSKKQAAAGANEWLTQQLESDEEIPF